MVAAGKLLQVILVFADRFLQILVGLEFPQDIRIYQFLLILQQLLNSSDMLELDTFLRIWVGRWVGGLVESLCFFFKRKPSRIGLLLVC